MDFWCRFKSTSSITASIHPFSSLEILPLPSGLEVMVVTIFNLSTFVATIVNSSSGIKGASPWRIKVDSVWIKGIACFTASAVPRGLG